MRNRMYLGLVILAVALFASAMPSNHAAQNSENAPSEKVKSLMKERRDVLANRVSVFESRLESGIIDISSVVYARDDLLAAELELAETREHRIELLKSRVENFKLSEQRILEMYKSQGPNVSTTDVLSATSRRLLAEIELERALSAN